MANKKPASSKKRTPATMTRYEILKELGAYAHPTWYQALFSNSTASLRGLLTYYRSSKGDKEDGALGLTVIAQISIR